MTVKSNFINDYGKVYSELGHNLYGNHLLDHEIVDETLDVYALGQTSYGAKKINEILSSAIIFKVYVIKKMDGIFNFSIKF